MTANLAAGLRALAASLPPETPVPVPAGALLELLAASKAQDSGVSPADPTVEDVAARYRRAPSTVRGWCEAGRFPGAYKLHHREWRIPAAAIEAFDAERRRDPPSGLGGRRARSLSDWRHAS